MAGGLVEGRHFGRGASTCGGSVGNLGQTVGRQAHLLPCGQHGSGGSPQQ